MEFTIEPESIDRVSQVIAHVVGPAFVLTMALSYLIGRVVGIDMFDMASAEPPPGAAFMFAIITAFVNYAIGDAISAGLSTALYRDLGGRNAALPPR